MVDLLELTAIELGEAYRLRRVSPVEVTRAVLQAAEATQSTLNAFAVLNAEGALASAEQAERRWFRGAALSALDGVPISIKDNVYVEGMPTRFGSLAIPAERATGPDSPCAARLREAGVILFGKTTMPDYGHKMVTDSPLTGVTRNPWSVEHSPGGSSGGAAAAVAAGIGPIAIGTDGAGSIRIPAAWTGVFGLKSSLGRVPHHPRGAFGSYSHVGPMTRTVADAARVMKTITQPDARDWYSLPYSSIDYELLLAEDLRGTHVAFSSCLGLAVATDAEISRAVEQAATVFEALGARVELADPPAVDQCTLVADLHFTTAAAQLVSFLGARASLLDASLLALAEAGARVPASAVLDALAKRAELGTRVNQFFEHFDLVLAPVIPFGAPVLMQIDPNLVLPPLLTQWCNVTGLPAASICCGFSRDGLPIGLQIIGRRWDDVRVLCASYAYELARGQLSRLEGYRRAPLGCRSPHDNAPHSGVSGP